MRIAWNKGLTKETDKRVLKNSISGKENKRKSHLGLKHSIETKKKIGKALKDRKILWKDKISKTLKNKYDVGLIKKRKRQDNPQWKGNNAKYAAFHLRVQQNRGTPQKCEICKTEDKNKTYEWASINKRYSDINDYKRMCKSCHNLFDREKLR